jgi:hypothetical protein
MPREEETKRAAVQYASLIKPALDLPIGNATDPAPADDDVDLVRGVGCWWSVPSAGRT